MQWSSNKKNLKLFLSFFSENLIEYPGWRSKVCKWLKHLLYSFSLYNSETLTSILDSFLYVRKLVILKILYFHENSFNLYLMESQVIFKFRTWGFLSGAAIFLELFLFVTHRSTDWFSWKVRGHMVIYKWGH